MDRQFIAGTVTATVVPPSDARFKENIAPAKPQLADVVALGGILKNFDWNEEAPVNDELRAQRQLGLIAQEVDDVCPTLTKTIHRTKKGKELTPEQVIPAVYEEQVVPAVYKEEVVLCKCLRGKSCSCSTLEKKIVDSVRDEEGDGNYSTDD